MSNENGFLVNDRHLCPFSPFSTAILSIFGFKNMGRNICIFDFFIKIKTWNREQIFFYFSKKYVPLQLYLSKECSSFSDFLQVILSISSKQGSGHWMRLRRLYFLPAIECEFQQVKNPHRVEITLLTKLLHVDNFIV